MGSWMERWPEVPSPSNTPWLHLTPWRAHWAHLCYRKSTRSSWLSIPAFRVNTVDGPWSHALIWVRRDYLREQARYWMGPFLENFDGLHTWICPRFLRIWDVCCWWCSIYRLDGRKLELVDYPEAVPGWRRLVTWVPPLLWWPRLYDHAVWCKAFLGQALSHCLRYAGPCAPSVHEPWLR